MVSILFRLAVSALARNRLRSVLTVTGMAVGIAAVITVAALGAGAREAIEDQVEAAGTNLITINAGNRTANGVRLGMGASSRLTADDAAAVGRVPGVAYVSPSVRTRQQIIAAGRNWSTIVEGSGADLARIRAWGTVAGTFFGPVDVADTAKVCVLGTIVRDMVFGRDANPVGAMVRIGNQPFRVVGVLSPKGQSSGGRDQDDVVFIPYTTAQKKLMGVTYLNGVTVSATSSESIAAVAQRIREVLRVRHGTRPGDTDDFRVRTLEERLAVRLRTTRTMTLLMGAVGAVSLVVGGIGVMNIMLVSVTSRTREVGLRLAVGARARDVLLQFLTEAMVISLLGGFGGVVLGYGCAIGLNQAFDWPTSLSAKTALVAVAVASITGLFFGWYPARRAASTSPIESLRFE